VDLSLIPANDYTTVTVKDKDGNVVSTGVGESAAPLTGKGTLTGTLSLDAGRYTDYTVLVTAQNNVDTAEYTLRLERIPDSLAVGVKVDETEADVVGTAFTAHTSVKPGEPVHVEVEAKDAATALTVKGLGGSVDAAGTGSVGVDVTVPNNAAFTLDIVATNGSESQDYTLTIIRDTFNTSVLDIRVKSLEPTPGPAVYPDEVQEGGVWWYVAYVEKGYTGKVNVAVTPTDDTAVVTVAGTIQPSPLTGVDLEHSQYGGEATILLEVGSETYRLKIREKSSDVSLKVHADGVELTADAEGAYNAMTVCDSVELRLEGHPYATVELRDSKDGSVLTATDGAAVKGTGTVEATVALPEGADGEWIVLVTAQDGETTKSYPLNIRRVAEPLRITVSADGSDVAPKGVQYHYTTKKLPGQSVSITVTGSVISTQLTATTDAAGADTPLAQGYREIHFDVPIADNRDHIVYLHTSANVGSQTYPIVIHRSALNGAIRLITVNGVYPDEEEDRYVAWVDQGFTGPIDVKIVPEYTPMDIFIGAATTPSDIRSVPYSEWSAGVMTITLDDGNGGPEDPKALLEVRVKSTDATLSEVKADSAVVSVSETDHKTYDHVTATKAPDQVKLDITATSSRAQVSLLDKDGNVLATGTGEIHTQVAPPVGLKDDYTIRVLAHADQGKKDAVPSDYPLLIERIPDELAIQVTFDTEDPTSVPTSGSTFTYATAKAPGQYVRIDVESVDAEAKLTVGTGLKDGKIVGTIALPYNLTLTSAAEYTLYALVTKGDQSKTYTIQVVRGGAVRGLDYGILLDNGADESNLIVADTEDTYPAVSGDEADYIGYVKQGFTGDLPIFIMPGSVGSVRAVTINGDPQALPVSTSTPVKVPQGVWEHKAGDDSYAGIPITIEYKDGEVFDYHLYIEPKSTDVSLSLTIDGTAVATDGSAKSVYVSLGKTGDKLTTVLTGHPHAKLELYDKPVQTGKAPYDWAMGTLSTGTVKVPATDKAYLVRVTAQDTSVTNQDKDTFTVKRLDTSLLLDVVADDSTVAAPAGFVSDSVPVYRYETEKQPGEEVTLVLTARSSDATVKVDSGATVTGANGKQTVTAQVALQDNSAHTVSLTVTNASGAKQAYEVEVVHKSKVPGILDIRVEGEYPEEVEQEDGSVLLVAYLDPTHPESDPIKVQAKGVKGGESDVTVNGTAQPDFATGVSVSAADWNGGKHITVAVDGEDYTLTVRYKSDNANLKEVKADSATLTTADPGAVENSVDYYYGTVKDNAKGETVEIAITAEEPSSLIELLDKDGNVVRTAAGAALRGKGSLTGSLSVPKDTGESDKTDRYTVRVTPQSGNSKGYSLLIDHLRTDSAIAKETVDGEERFVVKLDKDIYEGSNEYPDDFVSYNTYKVEQVDPNDPASPSRPTFIFRFKAGEDDLDMKLHIQANDPYAWVSIDGSGIDAADGATTELDVTVKPTGATLPVKVTADDGTATDYTVKILPFSDDVHLSTVTVDGKGPVKTDTANNIYDFNTTKPMGSTLPFYAVGHQDSMLELFEADGTTSVIALNPGTLKGNVVTSGMEKVTTFLLRVIADSGESQDYTIRITYLNSAVTADQITLTFEGRTYTADAKDGKFHVTAHYAAADHMLTAAVAEDAGSLLAWGDHEKGAFPVDADVTISDDIPSSELSETVAKEVYFTIQAEDGTRKKHTVSILMESTDATLKITAGNNSNADMPQRTFQLPKKVTVDGVESEQTSAIYYVTGAGALSVPITLGIHPKALVEYQVGTEALAGPFKQSELNLFNVALPAGEKTVDVKVKVYAESGAPGNYVLTIRRVDNTNALNITTDMGKKGLVEADHKKGIIDVSVVDGVKESVLLTLSTGAVTSPFTITDTNATPDTQDSAANAAGNGQQATKSVKVPALGDTYEFKVAVTTEAHGEDPVEFPVKEYTVRVSTIPSSNTLESAILSQKGDVAISYAGIEADSEHKVGVTRDVDNNKLTDTDPDTGKTYDVIQIESYDMAIVTLAVKATSPKAKVSLVRRDEQDDPEKIATGTGTVAVRNAITKDKYTDFIATVVPWDSEGEADNKTYIIRVYTQSQDATIKHSEEYEVPGSEGEWATRAIVGSIPDPANEGAMLMDARDAQVILPGGDEEERKNFRLLVAESDLNATGGKVHVTVLSEDPCATVAMETTPRSGSMTSGGERKGKFDGDITVPAGAQSAIFNIQITAEAGSPRKDYVLTVAVESADASYQAPWINGRQTELDPDDHYGTTAEEKALPVYAGAVGKSVDSADLKVQANNEQAKIEYHMNNDRPAYGVKEAGVMLGSDPNKSTYYKVTITAVDGKGKQSFWARFDPRPDSVALHSLVVNDTVVDLTVPAEEMRSVTYNGETVLAYVANVKNSATQAVIQAAVDADDPDHGYITAVSGRVTAGNQDLSGNLKYADTVTFEQDITDLEEAVAVITVTAQDGVTQKPYYVLMTRTVYNLTLDKVLVDGRMSVDTFVAESDKYTLSAGTTKDGLTPYRDEEVFGAGFTIDVYADRYQDGALAAKTEAAVKLQPTAADAHTILFDQDGHELDGRQDGKGWVFTLPLTATETDDEGNEVPATTYHLTAMVVSNVESDLYRVYPVIVTVIDRATTMRSDLTLTVEVMEATNYVDTETGHFVALVAPWVSENNGFVLTAQAGRSDATIGTDVDSKTFVGEITRDDMMRVGMAESKRTVALSVTGADGESQGYVLDASKRSTDVGITVIVNKEKVESADGKEYWKIVPAQADMQSVEVTTNDPSAKVRVDIPLSDGTPQQGTWYPQRSGGNAKFAKSGAAANLIRIPIQVDTTGEVKGEYTLYIYKNPSSATIKSVEADGVAAGITGVTTYMVNIASDATSFLLSVTAGEADSHININNRAYTDVSELPLWKVGYGATEEDYVRISMPLEKQSMTIPVTIISETGQSREYTISVERRDKSDELEEILVNNVPSKRVTLQRYESTLPHEAQKANVVIKAKDPNALLQVYRIVNGTKTPLAGGATQRGTFVLMGADAVDVRNVDLTQLSILLTSPDMSKTLEYQLDIVKTDKAELLFDLQVNGESATYIGVNNQGIDTYKYIYYSAEEDFSKGVNVTVEAFTNPDGSVSFSGKSGTGSLKQDVLLTGQTAEIPIITKLGDDQESYVLIIERETGASKLKSLMVKGVTEGVDLGEDYQLWNEATGGSFDPEVTDYVVHMYWGNTDIDSIRILANAEHTYGVLQLEVPEGASATKTSGVNGALDSTVTVPEALWTDADGNALDFVELHLTVLELPGAPQTYILKLHRYSNESRLSDLQAWSPILNSSGALTTRYKVLANDPSRADYRLTVDNEAAANGAAGTVTFDPDTQKYAVRVPWSITQVPEGEVPQLLLKAASLHDHRMTMANVRIEQGGTVKGSGYGSAQGLIDLDATDRSAITTARIQGLGERTGGGTWYDVEIGYMSSDATIASFDHNQPSTAVYDVRWTDPDTKVVYTGWRSDVTTYQLLLPNSTAKVGLKFQPTDEFTSVTVKDSDGNTIPLRPESDNMPWFYKDITLKEGYNKVEVLTVSEDGTKSMNYTVWIYRTPYDATDWRLKDLVVHNYSANSYKEFTLVPDFRSDLLGYAVTIPGTKDLPNEKSAWFQAEKSSETTTLNVSIANTTGDVSNTLSNVSSNQFVQVEYQAGANTAQGLSRVTLDMVPAQNDFSHTYAMDVYLLDDTWSNLDDLGLAGMIVRHQGVSGNAPYMPAFDTDEFNYYLNVGSTVSQLDDLILTPVDMTNATAVKVERLSIQGETGAVPYSEWRTDAGVKMFDAIPLSVGDNVFRITVQTKMLDASGSPVVDDEGANVYGYAFYSLTVNRAEAGKDAYLTSLSADAGVLTPIFDRDVYQYALSVGSQKDTLAITPVTDIEDAVITVDNQSTKSGNSVPVALNFGDNRILVTVTNGKTVARYFVTVNRANVGENAKLASMTSKTINIVPDFVSEQPVYAATVGSSVGVFDLDLVAQKSTAQIVVRRVGGSVIDTGTGSLSIGQISLSSGANQFEILVTDGGSSTRYTLEVTRNNADYDLDLINLETAPGVLSPVFTPSQLSYFVSLPAQAATLDVTAWASDAEHCKLYINNVETGSGEKVTLPMAYGDNIVMVKVVRTEGGMEYTNTYAIHANRNVHNLYLTDLEAEDTNITPPFNRDVEDYYANVNFDTGVQTDQDTLRIKPTTDLIGVDLLVANMLTPNATFSDPVSLSLGRNLIRTMVRYENSDGTFSRRVYSLTVNRGASDDVFLTALNTDHGSLTPFPFDQECQDLYITVPYAASTIRLQPKRDVVSETTATVKVGAEAVALDAWSTPIALNVGDNTVYVTVTLSNGVAREYTVRINRRDTIAHSASLTALTAVDPAAPSDLTDPTNTNVPLSTFIPDARPQTGTSFYLTVLNRQETIRLQTKAEDPNATVKVNGAIVDEKGYSYEIPLNVGENIITVEVTEIGGVHKIRYTVTVYRNGTGVRNGELGDLSVTNLSGDVRPLSPTFISGGHLYRTTMLTGEDQAVIHTVSVDSGARVTINNIPVDRSGDLTVDLVEGINPFFIKTTSGDGSKTTMTELYITAEGLGVDVPLLRELDVNNGTLLDPSGNPFQSTAFSYNATVGSEVERTDLTAEPMDTADIVEMIDPSGTIYSIRQGAGYVSDLFDVPEGYSSLTVHVSSYGADGLLADTAYTVEVYRPGRIEGSNYLQDLAALGYDIAPVFERTHYDYYLTLPDTVSTFTVVPRAEDDKATITIQQDSYGVQTTTSGASSTFSMTSATSVITIKVKKAGSILTDGSDTRTYTLNVVRVAGLALDSLELSDGTLAPVFASDIFGYNAKTTLPTIKLRPSSTTAQIINVQNLDGLTEADRTAITVGNGTWSSDIGLAAGNNHLLITLIRGSQKAFYAVTVNYAGSSSASNTRLMDLTIHENTAARLPVQLVAPFKPEELNYYASVGADISSVIVKAIPEASWSPDSAISVRVNNVVCDLSYDASAIVPLQPGRNIVRIQSTAADATSEGAYTVIIYRAFDTAPLNDATLKAIDVLGGVKAKVVPTVTAGNFNYELVVDPTAKDDSVTVSFTPTDPNAKIYIRSTDTAITQTTFAGPVSDGQTLYLNVVAADGKTTNVYSLTVRVRPIDTIILSGQAATLSKVDPVSGASLVGADHTVEVTLMKEPDSGDQSPIGESIFTGKDGKFSFTVHESGKYYLVIKRAGYLDQIITSISLEKGMVRDIGTIQLVPGDVVYDGVVDNKDLALLRSLFGASASDPIYKASADFYDRGTISFEDLVITTLNFGLSVDDIVITLDP